METLFTGQTIIRLNSVDSTNNYAASLLNTTNVPEGTVIVAQEQTAGRGQRGADWLTIPGKNLTFSLILQPKFLTPDHQFLLSQAVALAIYEVIAGYDPGAIIKWPNDILVNGKKIAGILIENRLSGKNLGHSVIGIGINVNQETFPPGIPAVSLFQILKHESVLDEILEKVCRQLEKWYLLLKGGKHIQVKQAYESNLLNFHQWGKYELNGKVTEAYFERLTSEGKMVLKFEEGNEQAFDVKEIRTVI